MKETQYTACCPVRLGGVNSRGAAVYQNLKGDTVKISNSL